MASESGTRLLPALVWPSVLPIVPPSPVPEPPPTTSVPPGVPATGSKIVSVSGTSPSVPPLVPFPSADDLVTVLERTTGAAPVTPSIVADRPTLLGMIELTRQVPIASHVLRHAVDLVVGSQPGSDTAPATVRQYVRFGASPRGAQSLVLAGKVRALWDGRPNVSIDDIRAVAPAALRHRLVVGYEATADGVTTDDIVDELLGAVLAPGAGMRGAP